MNSKQKNCAVPDGALEGAKIIFELAGLQDFALAVALDKVFRSYTGYSALKLGGVVPDYFKK